VSIVSSQITLQTPKARKIVQIIFSWT